MDLQDVLQPCLRLDVPILRAGSSAALWGLRGNGHPGSFAMDRLGSW